MGLREWWAKRQRKTALIRQSQEFNDSEELISQHAPELVGMGFVAGGAFILDEIDKFNATATPEQSAELAGRLMGIGQKWQDDGLTMPYWVNLAVLRQVQAEIARGEIP